MAETDQRQRTLLALLSLAEGSNPGDCWDDARAIELLRSQSTRDELGALGASVRLLDHIFGRNVGA